MTDTLLCSVSELKNKIKELDNVEFLLSYVIELRQEIAKLKEEMKRREGKIFYAKGCESLSIGQLNEAIELYQQRSAQ